MVFCTVCGKKSEHWIFRHVIWDDLAFEWGLDVGERDFFDKRESNLCIYCGNSARTRALAEAILHMFPIDNANNLSSWVSSNRMGNLAVAEINSCGKLHPFLQKLPYLYYSEYSDGNEYIWKIRNFLMHRRREDIMNLSYENNLFDLVIHSEVLEHVPDPLKALHECRRVLKPGGICLFTTPVLPYRSTVCRVKQDESNGTVHYIKKRVYHGKSSPLLHLVGKEGNLVWWEFGGDILSLYGLQTYTSQDELDVYFFKK